ncbi:MAG: transcriptional repressor LexA [Leptospiraceae bacterium]|nr:transcriptional repressor LexA [Leptospiraceae bacterium]MDW8305881.1 transcriptional repressor LexA [Leptospiraceae bacterium]
MVQDQPPIEQESDSLKKKRGRPRGSTKKPMGENNGLPVYPFPAGSGTLGLFRAKSKRINEEKGKFSLTEKQAKILNFIKAHIGQLGFPPTIRQIANYYSISAKAAHDHLRAIANKGYLRLFPGSARGIELIDRDQDDVVYVPLIGAIAAGRPTLAEESVEKRIPLPRSFLAHAAGELFALRVRGDSMEKAGILDGDIAVIKQVSDYKSEVQNGDIVAALIDQEATLKTFYRKKDTIELHPANDRYPVIRLEEKDDPQILGKLVGIYRRY